MHTKTQKERRINRIYQLDMRVVPQVRIKVNHKMSGMFMEMMALLLEVGNKERLL